MVSYIYIYVCIRFFFNLFRCTIACHKVLANFILKYIFFFQICTFVPYIRLALVISGDLEDTPGPETTLKQNISLYHWNLNVIAAHSCVKVSFLEAYNTVHNFDISCISETFLDYDYSSDDPRLNLQGML